VKRAFGRTSAVVVATVILGMVAACTGETPLLSTPIPASSVPSVVTVTITSTGVDPKVLTISQGQRVLFVNNDSVSHEMASDVHPTHEQWPAMNQVGYLAPGQSRETGNLNAVGGITYHDHLDAQNELLLGTIEVTPLD